jgi:protein-tyrosine phosphatase
MNLIEQHEKKHMKSICEVLPGKLYLGNIFAALKKDVLKKYNITHIVNVTQEVSNCHPNDFVYHKINIMDMFEFSSQLEQALPNTMEFIHQEDAVVFVHCKQGVSRSVTVVLSYLIKYNEMTLQEAYWHVKGVRPEIKPNDSFLSLLMKLEVECYPHLNNQNTFQHRDLIVVEYHEKYPKLSLEFVRKILEENNWDTKTAWVILYQKSQELITINDRIQSI